MYMETHKLVLLLESMTAAVMTAKPDDPAKFLEQKLRDHHFGASRCWATTRKTWTRCLRSSTSCGPGAITQEQCDKAIIAMTGHKAKPRTDPRAGDQGGVHAARQGGAGRVHRLIENVETAKNIAPYSLLRILCADELTAQPSRIPRKCFDDPGTPPPAFSPWYPFMNTTARPDTANSTLGEDLAGNRSRASSCSGTPRARTWRPPKRRTCTAW